MISVFEKDNTVFLNIGKHVLQFTSAELGSVSQALTEQNIEKISNFDLKISEGSWTIEGALDDISEDNPKSETRRRLLLSFKDKSWHILRSEAVRIGELLRSVS